MEEIWGCLRSFFFFFSKVRERKVGGTCVVLYILVSGDASTAVMSRFVKEGSIPSADLQLEEIRALKEELVYLKKEELKNRKTLQEQLYENRVRKAAEYQELTSQLNSTYKINEKDMEYYEALRLKEEMRELDKQIQEEESLEEFRKLRIQNELKEKQKSRVVKSIPTKVQKRIIVKKKSDQRAAKRLKTSDSQVSAKNNEFSQVATKGSALLGGYDSSSSEDE